MLLLKAGFYAIWVTNVCESRKTLAIISPSIVHVRHKLILQTRAAPRQFSAVLTENFLRIAVTEKNVTTLYLVHNCPLISYLCTYSIYSNARWGLFHSIWCLIMSGCLKLAYEVPNWTAPNRMALNLTTQCQTKACIAILSCGICALGQPIGPTWKGQEIQHRAEQKWS